MFFWMFFFALPILLLAQDPVTLQFTGRDQNGYSVKMHHIAIENITKRWQEILYYPDTTLNIGVTSIEEFGQVDKGLRLFQNVPNPFDGITDFALQLPKASDILLEIYDLNGRIETLYQGSLDQGCHQFRAWLASPKTYLLYARTENGTLQIKMVNTGHSGQSHIEYIGKGYSLWVVNPKNETKGNTTMPFNYGDTMSYQGIAHLANRDFTSNSVVKAQYNSELIPLNFTLPLPTVTTEVSTNITSESAQLNGSVVEHPEYHVRQRGFYIADNEFMNGAREHPASSGESQFHLIISNLQFATRYYYRAFVLTEIGTTYGDVLFFDTQAKLPTVHTLNVTDINDYKASCGGQVISTGGAPVTARGVCWSTVTNPTVNENHTTDSAGLGLFTSLIMGLTGNTTYYVRAYATNSQGTAYGEQRVFTTLPPFYCGIDTVVDYDGNIYQTVEIGQQCWMKENLRSIHNADGTEIPLGSVPSVIVGYRYYANADSSSVSTLGYLYNWQASMHGAVSSDANPSGVQGICPVGWHLPSHSEFTQLMNYIGSQSQYVCGEDNRNIAKALADTTGWYEVDGYCCVGNTPETNNATGFTGHPTNNTFDASFWSSTQIVYSSGDVAAYHLMIYYYSARLYDHGVNLSNVMSVRCLRN